MTDKPALIVVSGVDGSGKTSIIEGVQAFLESEGIDNRYIWLRYNHYLTKFLLAFCKFTGFTRYEHFEQSRVVYHDFHRSKIIAWAFVWLTWIDTFLASLLRVYIPRLFSKKAIICDRWAYDIMVDLEIDTRLDFSEGSFLHTLFKLILPDDAKCFVISRNLEATKGTRDESVNDRNFPIRHQLYVRHEADRDLNVIDNNGAINESIDQVLSQVELGVGKESAR